MDRGDQLSMFATSTISIGRSGQHGEQPAGSSGNGSGDAPECCRSCGYYKPKIWYLMGRDCAAFGTVAGIKDSSCGLWNPR